MAMQKLLMVVLKFCFLGMVILEMGKLCIRNLLGLLMLRMNQSCWCHFQAILSFHCLLVMEMGWLLLWFQRVMKVRFLVMILLG
uniref:Transmembrane protein n=1 Tax=Medicago truncatula TaxID=3880 RepID=I3S4Z6_MEDTR|nr:unknown [Medicago truncatula]